MKPVEAVFFDLDETLLDDNTSFVQSIAGACSELVAAIPGVSHELLFESYQSLSQAYWLEIEQDVVRGTLDGQTVRLETWRRTLSACGCEDQFLARAALDAYSRYRSASYKLFDDAQNVLDELKARFPLALITNGASYTQWDKVKATGIGQYFDLILVSGDAGVGKPGPAIFRLALDQLGVRAGATIHVGDSLVNDIGGGNSVGIRTVWLNRPGAPRNADDPKPDHEIRGLRELLPLLA